MPVNRRYVLRTVGAAAALAATGAQAITIEGLVKPPEADEETARDIISRLPKSDYVAIMEALSKLDKTEKWSTSDEPFNRRWRYYANPLLVDIWNSMGYSYTNDCTSWCGVTLGWALKRDGRKVPKNCPSSQSYLNYGTAVKTPLPGDLCVFTNRADGTHGHVTIFRKTVDVGDIEVLGGNQTLSDPTNCGAGYTANIIDRRSMALSTPTHYLNRYVSPPARS
jgi:uncharacterized protein (TIGR02594 family)